MAGVAEVEELARLTAPPSTDIAEAIGAIEYAMKWLPDIQDAEARDAIEMCLVAARAHLKQA